MSKNAYLSSPLSAELVSKIHANLAAVRAKPGDKASSHIFVETINIMTEESMAYYFFQPMNIINASKMTRKFVSMGVSGAVKMVNTMGKKAVSSLDEEQMLQLCDFLESLVYEE